MSIVIPKVGAVKMLENLVGKTASQNLTLKLYSNNLVPDTNTVAGDFTEVSGSGYAAKTLTMASWNSATSGSPSYIDYATQLFTFTDVFAGVYGYYIVEETSGVLKWCERFTGAPYDITLVQNKIELTPRIEAS